MGYDTQRDPVQPYYCDELECTFKSRTQGPLTRHRNVCEQIKNRKAQSAAALRTRQVEAQSPASTALPVAHIPAMPLESSEPIMEVCAPCHSFVYLRS
jgi:hypothetical protein